MLRYRKTILPSTYQHKRVVKAIVLDHKGQPKEVYMQQPAAHFPHTFLHQLLQKLKSLF